MLLFRNECNVDLGIDTVEFRKKLIRCSKKLVKRAYKLDDKDTVLSWDPGGIGTKNPSDHIFHSKIQAETKNAANRRRITASCYRKYI